MLSTSHRLYRSAILLAAAMVWVVSVTLCSTRVLGEAGVPDGATAGHSHHDHATPHDHGNNPNDDGCGCTSFKAFPVQATALTKTHVPPEAIHLYTLFLEELGDSHAASDITAQNTGPPQRISWAELILERCRLSHAPPAVV